MGTSLFFFRKVGGGMFCGTVGSLPSAVGALEYGARPMICFSLRSCARNDKFRDRGVVILFWVCTPCKTFAR